MTGPDTTLTLKAGRLAPTWHAAHILLSVLTCGWWLPVYGLHALYSLLTRPTVQVHVPAGHRVEYRDGWPNVLGPDEYLTPRTPRERAMIVGAWGAPVLIVAAILVGFAIRS